VEGKKTTNQNIQQYYYEEDEIDLYELWLTLKKRKKIILSTTLTFFIISLVYIFIATPVYKSAFTIKLPKKEGSLLITQYEIKNLIDNINYLLKEKNFKEISKLLNIKEEDIKKIKNISLKKDRNAKDIATIEIETIDKNLVPNLEKGVYLFLDSNPFLKEKIKNERLLINKEIETLSSKISDLYEIRNDILEKIKKNEIKELGFNPQDLDIKIIDLKVKIDRLKTILKEIKGIEISIPAIIPENPYKPKKTLILAVATISGLFLGVFLAFFLEWLENVKRRYQEEKSNAS